MSENKDDKENTQKEVEVQIEEEIDEEALNVILRLYDKTFRELAKR